MNTNALEALDELYSAIKDAQKRWLSGDNLALNSDMLRCCMQ